MEKEKTNTGRSREKRRDQRGTGDERGLYVYLFVKFIYLFWEKAHGRGQGRLRERMNE